MKVWVAYVLVLPEIAGSRVADGIAAVLRRQFLVALWRFVQRGASRSAVGVAAVVSDVGAVVGLAGLVVGLPDVLVSLLEQLLQLRSPREVQLRQLPLLVLSDSMSQSLLSVLLLIPRDVQLSTCHVLLKRSSGSLSCIHSFLGTI